MRGRLIAIDAQGPAFIAGPGFVRARANFLVASRRAFDTLLGPIVSAFVALSGTVYIFLNNPHVLGALGWCPLYYNTGMWCPGCGGTRAVYDLAHGDIAGAMAMNPVFTLAVPVLIVLWFRWVLYARGRPTKPWNIPDWAYVTVGLAALGFFVLRNVPAFAPYLAP